MKSLAVLLVVFVLCSISSAQSPASSNGMYIEFLGNGLVYSLNYDRMISESIGARVGIGYIEPFIGESVITFPVMVNYFIGSGNSKLELGFGACYVSQTENSGFSFMDFEKEFEGSGALGTATIGYRYQRASGGFIFRAGFTPFFGKIGFWPYFGITAGYGF